MTTFLPDGYEKPASNSKYYKFAAGDNHFRILSPAITGWIDWDTTPEGKKPIRTKERPSQSIDPTKPVKHFWAFIIWDYQDKSIKILEITQSTIQDAIFNLHNDKNWGNPQNYDFNIKKTGEKMETKYSIMPIPPQELNEEIKTAYRETKINLEKLYTNEDPFENISFN